MQQDSLESQLSGLKAQVSALEEEIRARTTPRDWPPTGYYATYHLMAGAVLGLFGAGTSLLFNTVGALMVGRHPLELIRVYLTFPIGEKALTLESGFTLAAGCCLYLATGMLLGVPFYYVLTRFFSKTSGLRRFIVGTVLSLAIWLFNFYGLISWIQPLLIGGSWIIERVPVYVAIATHLVFGWTMLLIDQWGRYVPDRGAGGPKALA